MRNISISELDSEVRAIFAQYNDEVYDVMKNATDACAKTAVTMLRTQSPVDEKSPTGGAYAKSWKQKLGVRKGRAYSRFAYNEKHYRLTHLLEYGHALKRGGRTVGQAKAVPHIERIENEVSNLYEETIERGLS